MFRMIGNILIFFMGTILMIYKEQLNRSGEKMSKWNYCRLLSGICGLVLSIIIFNLLIFPTEYQIIPLLLIPNGILYWIVYAMLSDKSKKG